MIDWLSAWYNLPFLCVFTFGIMLSLVSLLGVFGDSDVNADVDHVDLDFDQSSEVGHDHEFGVHWAFIAWLGVGKAPLSVLLQTLLLSFGLTGLILNAITRDLFGGSGWVFPAVLLVATGTCLWATRMVGRSFNKWMPNPTPQDQRNDKYVGAFGVAASRIPVVGKGQARLDDGTYVVAFSGEGDAISRGTRVFLAHYDISKKAYVAVETEDNYAA